MVLGTWKITEHKVTQWHRTSVWDKGILPVLIDIKAIETRQRAKVRECHVCHISGPSWVGLYERDVVALNNVYIPSFLLEQWVHREFRENPWYASYNIWYLCWHIQTANRDAWSSLIADEILYQGKVWWAFDRDTFVSIGDLGGTVFGQHGRKFLVLPSADRPVFKWQ